MVFGQFFWKYNLKIKIDKKYVVSTYEQSILLHKLESTKMEIVLVLIYQKVTAL